MIRILRDNGTFDYVKPQFLEALIERREIVSFRRQDGVVLLGVDPVRKAGGCEYRGEERRCMSS